MRDKVTTTTHETNSNGRRKELDAGGERDRLDDHSWRDRRKMVAAINRRINHAMDGSGGSRERKCISCCWSVVKNASRFASRLIVAKISKRIAYPRSRNGSLSSLKLLFYEPIDRNPRLMNRERCVLLRDFMRFTRRARFSCEFSIFSLYTYLDICAKLCVIEKRKRFFMSKVS